MHERRHITSTRWAGTVGNVAPRPDTSRIPADEGGALIPPGQAALFIYLFFLQYIITIQAGLTADSTIHLYIHSLGFLLHTSIVYGAIYMYQYRVYIYGF